MYRVKNKSVIFTLYEKGKIKKQIELKNRLTDLYLDYVLFRNLPATIGSSIYPSFDLDDNTFNLFSTSYLKFNTTQTIDDTDTTMLYDAISYSLTPSDITIKVGTSNKTMTTNYYFDLSSIANDSLFAGVGFGRNALLVANYLFSFIDLSGADIRKTADTGFGITRYDEIISNETSSEGTYLPFRGVSSDEKGELNKIYLCYGENGTGERYTYELSDLTFTRISAGEIEIRGLNNFYIEDEGLYPADDLYPKESLYLTSDSFVYVSSIGFDYIVSYSYDGDYYVGMGIKLTQDGINKYFTITAFDDLTNRLTLTSTKYSLTATAITDIYYSEPSNSLYPTEVGQVKSVVFEYLLTDESVSPATTRLLETYINKEDLDVSYNDTEFKIKTKCERGDY